MLHKSHWIIGLKFAQPVPDSGQEHFANSDNGFFMSALGFDSVIPLLLLLTVSTCPVLPQFTHFVTFFSISTNKHTLQNVLSIRKSEHFRRKNLHDYKNFIRFITKIISNRFVIGVYFTVERVRNDAYFYLASAVKGRKIYGKSRDKSILIIDF